MDGSVGGGSVEEELTAQETALYDRQIRVWGVDAQKRCAAVQELTFLLFVRAPIRFWFTVNFFCILLVFLARVGYVC